MSLHCSGATTAWCPSSLMLNEPYPAIVGSISAPLGQSSMLTVSSSHAKTSSHSTTHSSSPCVSSFSTVASTMRLTAELRTTSNDVARRHVLLSHSSSCL